MNLQPFLNNKLPWALMESNFDMLCVAKMHAKYVVHSSKSKSTI
jgi:hypothetical protein